MSARAATRTNGENAPRAAFSIYVYMRTRALRIERTCICVCERGWISRAGSNAPRVIIASASCASLRCDAYRKPGWFSI